jgi:hypothetical protein
MNRLPIDLQNSVKEFLMPSKESVKNNKRLLHKNLEYATSWQNNCDYVCIEEIPFGMLTNEQKEQIHHYMNNDNIFVYKNNSNIIPSCVKHLTFPYKYSKQFYRTVSSEVYDDDDSIRPCKKVC